MQEDYVSFVLDPLSEACLRAGRARGRRVGADDLHRGTVDTDPMPQLSVAPCHASTIALSLHVHFTSLDPADRIALIGAYVCGFREGYREETT